MQHSHSLTTIATRRLPVATLALVAFAIVVSLVPGVANWLQYDRLAVAHGEVWRLVTSHFVHWSSAHLFWDALALAVLGWMCEREGSWRFLATSVGAAVMIPLTLSFAEPQMITYRGLSGIDSALFALLAALIVRRAIGEQDRSRLAMAILISVAFAAKIGFEVITGGTLFVNSAAAGMTPVPLAHVVGGLIGLAFGLMTAPLAREQVTHECDRSEPPDLFSDFFGPVDLTVCVWGRRRTPVRNECVSCNEESPAGSPLCAWWRPRVCLSSPPRDDRKSN